MSPVPVKPNPKELRALARRDPILGRAMRRVPAYPGVSPSTRRMSSFQYLCRAIVYQQLGGAAAASIYGRVERLTPESRFPSPKEMLALGEDRLRSAGLSAAKTRSILDLADRVNGGRLRLRRAATLPDEELIERLTAVWGIGEWTAQMYLMFKLGRLDVMPSTDLGIREGLRVLEGLDERPPPSHVLARSAPWAPLRTVASWVLWRLTDG